MKLVVILSHSGCWTFTEVLEVRSWFLIIIFSWSIFLQGLYMLILACWKTGVCCLWLQKDDIGC